MRTRMVKLTGLIAVLALAIPLLGQEKPAQDRQDAIPPPLAGYPVYADLDDDGLLDILAAYPVEDLVLLAQADKPKLEAVPGTKADRMTQSVREEKALSLEEMLTQALKNHPDIRVAEAKVREAEAEVDRAKLQVTQKVIAAYRAIENERLQARNAQEQIDRVTKLVQKGLAPKGELDRHVQDLADRKAKVADLEMELSHLLGRHSVRGSAATALTRLAQVSRADDDLRGLYTVHARSQGLVLRTRAVLAEQTARIGEPMADRIRKALDTPVSVNYKEKFLMDVLKDLEKQVPGVPIVQKLGDLSKRETRLTLEFSEKVPLAAALQAIQDMSGWVTFGVRDYGILALGDGTAVDMVSPQQFWKQPQPVHSNPPDKEVQGEVKAIEDKTGLIQINIGSDAGLQKGHTLEVFRLKPKPKYLGPIQLLEVKPKEAVGKPMRESKEPMQVGDQVSGKPPSRD